MYEPRRFPILPFVIVSILVLAGIGVFFLVTQNRAQEPEFEPDITSIPQPTPTQTPALVATPQLINTPTVLPTVTVAPDLRFGVVEREDGCIAINELVMRTLGDLNVQTASVLFDDADALYAALAEQAIDLTLCFQDPADRPFLTEHVGFLKTIDAPYFDDGELRLQVMVNAANVVPLREEQPCLMRFLQAMTFDERVDSAESWLTENQATINEWTDCR